MIAALSYVIYLVLAFCATLLLRRSWNTRLILAVAFPAALFLLCWVLDSVAPMGNSGSFLTFTWRSFWMIPGAFLAHDLTYRPEPLYSAEPELDWTHPLPDGRTLASWHLPRSDRRALGWINGTARQEIFQYNHESLGAWGSEFRDGIPDGRGGFFVAGMFLMTGHGGDTFPMLHFSANGELDRNFPYRTRFGMEAGQSLRLDPDGGIWLTINTAPSPTTEHYKPAWTFEVQ